MTHNSGIMGFDQRAFKSGQRRILRTLSFLAASSVALNCFTDPLEPVAPSWDVNLTIPLANRFYSLLEIVRKDTSLLRVGAGQQITYSTSMVAAPTTVGDLITISPNDTSLQVNFGVFRVDAPPLVAPLDIPWLPQGSSVPVPDTTIVTPDVQDTITTFESIIFEDGTIDLTIENNLPVDIEAVNPIQLLDNLGNVAATFTFNPQTIPANSSRTATDNLANRTLTNEIRLTGLVFHTPGSATPVPIPNGDLLVATLAANNLKARRAVFAEIPAQSLVNNDTADYSLDDSTIIQEVKLRSGILDLSFTNRVELAMIFKYRIDELQRPVGGTYIRFEDSVSLPRLGSGNVRLNLADHKIQSGSGDLVRSLKVISSVLLPVGSGQPVTVSDTDKVYITITRIEPIIADTARAILKPTWVDVNTVIGVDFGELPTHFSGQLNIPSASLGLGTLSSIGFPMDLHLVLAARTNIAGDSAYLQVPLTERRLSPGADSVQFDPAEVGQFLSQFSNRLPDSIRVGGRVLVNPPDVYSPTLAGVGTIGSNSSFGGSVHLDIPLHLGIVGGTYRDTLVVGDTTGDGTSDVSLHKDRIDDLNSGRMYIQVTNGMPIQLGVDLRFLDSLRLTVLSIPQSGQPVQVSAASVDGNGNVTVPAQSTATIELNRSELQQFDPAEFLSYSVALETTPGSPAVRFRTTDYVRIKVWSQLSSRVNP